MSGYDYYEFRTVDRLLSEAAMVALGGVSSRAEIAADRLVVTYNYGSFRGDPLALVHEHFDVMVHVSRYHGCRLLFRLPSRVVSPKSLRPYVADGRVLVHEKPGHVVVELVGFDEDGRDWVDEDEGPDAMKHALALRQQMLEGDLAPLYVAWLGAHANDDDDDATLEPPVPPGLRKPSRALQALVELLSVPDELLDVAAKASPTPPKAAGPTERAFTTWLRAVPERQRNEWLKRAAWEGETGIGAEVLRKFRKDTSAPAEKPVKGKRSVGELVTAMRRLDDPLDERKTAAVAKEAAANAQNAHVEPRLAPFADGFDVAREGSERAIKARAGEARRYRRRPRASS
ncbi:MAG: hypothetical protein MUF34_14005 [Polyangiaceae bacterium]|jgi:hypothetical protein|nr:hypothetical protein [Polyangiaceae bacterium]